MSSAMAACSPGWYSPPMTVLGFGGRYHVSLIFHLEPGPAAPGRSLGQTWGHMRLAWGQLLVREGGAIWVSVRPCWAGFSEQLATSRHMPQWPGAGTLL